VAAYDATASANYIFGFSITSGGVLTPLNGGAPLAGGAFAHGTCSNAFLNAPYELGTCPAAVASDASGSYLYVTDATVGKVHAYAIASGALTEVSGSPFTAGNAPSAIVVDPKYPYVYVTNALDSTVSAYSTSNGALTNLGTFATSTEPVAVGIDPSTNHFLFTANYLYNGVAGTVSGFELNPTSGALVNSQNSPFTIDAFPTAVAAIPHGVTTSSTKN
jgi:DNA-binding beta-propeller fold protein YncE